MGRNTRSKMNREEELKKLFDRIDALESKDKSLRGELKKVFGEHADEFIKFCDGQAGGDEDKALDFNEFKSGILNDSKDLSDEEFTANWITRMTGVVEEAEAAKKTEEPAEKTEETTEEKTEETTEEKTEETPAEKTEETPAEKTEETAEEKTEETPAEK